MNPGDHRISGSAFSHGQELADCATGQTVRSVSDVRPFPKQVWSRVAVDSVLPEGVAATEVAGCCFPGNFHREVRNNDTLISFVLADVNDQHALEIDIPFS